MATIENSIKDIEKVVKFDGKVNNIEVSRLTAPGENYLSLVLKVDLEVEEEDGESKIVSTVAKRLPLNKRNEKDFNIHSHVMNVEIKWYTEILPLLEDFARESGIELDFFPEFCGARYSLDSSKDDADGESVLILKNLIPEGYKNVDRYEGFDLITSKTTLKKLALFHALPIAMKTRKPESFQLLKDYLDKCHPNRPEKDSSDTEQKMPTDPAPKAKTPEDALLEALANIPDVAPHMPKLKHIYERQLETLKKITKEPWNTIRHNDFWLNNIMVNSIGKEPQVKILDFQMCRYGSFAKDLVFFLLTSIRNDDVRMFMDDLLKVYYHEFTSVLRKTKASFELNYEDYLEEVRSAAADSEIAHSIFFSTLIFAKKHADVDVLVDKFDPIEHAISMINNMSQRQKDKITVIVTEAVKRNWI